MTPPPRSGSGSRGAQDLVQPGLARLEGGGRLLLGAGVARGAGLGQLLLEGVDRLVELGRRALGASLLLRVAAAPALLVRLTDGLLDRPHPALDPLDVVPR